MVAAPKLFTSPCTIRMPKFMMDCWKQVSRDSPPISRITPPSQRKSCRRGRSSGQVRQK